MTRWTEELCAHLGVAARYQDYEGGTVLVSPETQSAVLNALGFDVANDAGAQDLLTHLRATDAQRPLPPEVIAKADAATRLPLAQPVEWCLVAEFTGQVLGSGQARESLTLPALPLGIHRLSLRTRDAETVTWVLARPDRAWGVSDCVQPPRVWGVLAALYGMTDGDAAALGSYDRLGAYVEAIARHGPDFLGLNPVHAMGPVAPGSPVSPYSPSHRAFLNTWYVAESGPGGATLIDYPSALAASSAALVAGFDAFTGLSQDTPAKRAFNSYVTAAGQPLRDFAIFEALASRFGTDWRSWPTVYQTPDSGAVTAFAQANGRDVQQAMWAQWCAETMLADAQSRARNAGMRLGLYLDLAVGPSLGGAETWDRDSALVTGAALGAPPDPLGPAGQNWNLAPQSPLKMRAQGYAGFARLLRAIMRHSGMIRIDHVLGLMRSFWIPEGSQEGTYVSYPSDALLAVVAIESRRNRAVVVGEDLGLVPDGLRAKLEASGIYGLDVLQFMRNDKGGFNDTRRARKKSVCAFATHDTATIAGFFTAEDARQHAAAGRMDHETCQAVAADRTAALATLGGADPVARIHEHLAKGAAEMVAVQLDDIAERRAQQNLPGTIDEYPNWRLRAPFTTGEIEASDSFARLGVVMAAQGRSNPQRRITEDELQDRKHVAH